MLQNLSRGYRLPRTPPNFGVLIKRSHNCNFSVRQKFGISSSFEKMAEEEVPKTAEPTNVAAPKMQQQDLPKLSMQDFRVYNRMSEHMDMFVSRHSPSHLSRGG